MSGGTDWTPDDDKTLARMIREGRSATAIGKELGRTRSSCCGRALRKGLRFHSQTQPIKTLVRFTEAEDKIIIALSALGKSGNDIAKAIDRSTSSVIKRARRLDANVHGKNGPAPKAPKVKAVKQQSRAHDPGFKHVPAVVAVVPRMVALVDLTSDMCRFPVAGERADTLFCGHPKEQRSYCLAHARLTYTAPEDRRRAA